MNVDTVKPKPTPIQVVITLTSKEACELSHFLGSKSIRLALRSVRALRDLLMAEVWDEYLDEEEDVVEEDGEA